MIRAEGTGELVRLPSIDISRISFAAMGGSAEDLRGAFPENDVAYDVDSSDEDLDGMEAAVERFERRAAERESLRAAAEANEDASRRLAAEARETARAVEGLREQRRRFEEARVVAVRGDKGLARVAGSIPGDADRPSSSFADDEERELRDLRERRRRVDERIARLLEEAAGYDREREMVAGSNPTRDDELALAVGDRERHRRMEEEEEAAARGAGRKDDDDDDDDYDYAPRWKRRQEERWAREAEEAAAALERAERAESADASTAPTSAREGEGPKAAGIEPPSPLVPTNATSRRENLRRAGRRGAARSEEPDDARGEPGDDLAEAARAIVENRAEDFARTLAHLTSLVDARDEEGDTLLHLAASLDRKRCVKTLVRAGANVGARNDAGVSVVERAIEHERFELADYLVKWCERHGVELG
jgi:hypothetical protein